MIPRLLRMVFGLGIPLQAAGVVSVRPLQSGHFKSSNSETRFISEAQEQLRWRLFPGVGFSSQLQISAADSTSGTSGTIDARHLAADPSTPISPAVPKTPLTIPSGAFCICSSDPLLKAEASLNLECPGLRVGSGATFRLDSSEHETAGVDARTRLRVWIDKVRVVQHVC